MTAKTEVLDARPPFTVLKTLDTRPITTTSTLCATHGVFAYVTWRPE